MSFISSIFSGLASKVVGAAATGGATIYKYLALAGIVLGMIVGGYGYGLHNGRLESKVAIAQFVASNSKVDKTVSTKADVIRDRIITQYVDRVKIVTKYKSAVDDATDKDTKDATVILSKQWICIHNAAATGADPSQCGGVK